MEPGENLIEFLRLIFLCCLYSDFRLFCVISEFILDCYIYFLILNYILCFLILNAIQYITHRQHSVHHPKQGASSAPRHKLIGWCKRRGEGGSPTHTNAILGVLMIFHIILYWHVGDWTHALNTLHGLNFYVDSFTFRNKKVVVQNEYSVRNYHKIFF